MNTRIRPSLTRYFLPVLAWSGLALLLPRLHAAPVQPVTVTVSADDQGAALAPRFLGLSYESSILLPQDGHYYFDADDQALVNMFKTLGVRSLRVGANAVDDPRVPIPQEKDIDMLFHFARAAGVKVIYSFRLKKGDPADSARLARYIATHYADALECFAIGNEANFYLKPYEKYFAQWKPHYDAILKAVPDAMLEGPSGGDSYALNLARDLFADGHLAMVSDHAYFLGSGRAGEKDPEATRARFLSNRLDSDYRADYHHLGAKLAAQGVPYRMDEMNSCFNGGSAGSSNSYASTLWALDCTQWWAAHHIAGLNYHTGESVGRDGKFGPPNYAIFLRNTDGPGFVMRPQGYGLLAFTEAAHGHALPMAITGAPKFDFTAYAYRADDGSYYLTLINKSYGEHAQKASVALRLSDGAGAGVWQRMDLVQENNDVAATGGVRLGGGVVDAQGNWSGQWQPLEDAKAADLTVSVAPASATLLHFERR